MPFFFFGFVFLFWQNCAISLPEFSGLHQEVIYPSRLDTQHVITIDRELLSFHFSDISSWAWSEIMKLSLWRSIIHCWLNFTETCNSKISSALIPAACSALFFCLSHIFTDTILSLGGSKRTTALQVGGKFASIRRKLQLWEHRCDSFLDESNSDTLKTKAQLLPH